MDEKPLESRESDVGRGKWYVGAPVAPPSRASNVMAFGLWVLFGAVGLGAVFAFEPYYTYFFRSDDNYERRAARQITENDTLPAMKLRFWWGAGAGGAGAAIYWFLRNNKRGARK